MGVQFISLGLVAELMVRTYHESQGKPTYVVKELRAAGPEPAGDSDLGGRDSLPARTAEEEPRRLRR
jgi:hypothetical protein